MGIMVYPLLWVMQDVYHQPYLKDLDRDPELETHRKAELSENRGYLLLGSL